MINASAFCIAQQLLGIYRILVECKPVHVKGFNSTQIVKVCIFLSIDQQFFQSWHFLLQKGGFGRLFSLLKRFLIRLIDNRFTADNDIHKFTSLIMNQVISSEERGEFRYPQIRWLLRSKKDNLCKISNISIDTCLFKCSHICGTFFNSNDFPRVTGRNQHYIHQESRCSSVSVHVRMDIVLEKVP